MKPRHAVVLIVLLVLGVSPATRADGVDDYVRSEMARQRIAGLSLAVVKDGRLVEAKAYGLANVELNVRATPETVYKLASVKASEAGRASGRARVQGRPRDLLQRAGRRLARIPHRLADGQGPDRERGQLRPSRPSSATWTARSGRRRTSRRCSRSRPGTR